MPRRLIYTPSGRAGEYANHGYAANLFSGCPHGCVYCYNTATPWCDVEKFRTVREPAPDVLARLEYDLTKRKGIPHPLPEPLFLCFTCDPCPTEDLIANITGPAIEIVHRSGNNVRMLTKGRMAPIALLHEGDEFGVTLTLESVDDECDWEIEAATHNRRIQLLRHAHDIQGVTTWASFEPVIDPVQTLALINKAAPVLDYCKIGKFNHGDSTQWPSEEWKRRVESIDWCDFTNKAARLCDDLGLPRYIKQDLRPYLEHGINPDTTNPVPWKQEARQ